MLLALAVTMTSCEKSLMFIMGESPAEFVVATESDTVAVVNGLLGKSAHKNFLRLVEEYPDVNTLLLEQVPGSINDEYNMQTGHLVRELGMTTMVMSHSEIASGGVDLFCAGLKRDIESGAKLGVHSWSGGGKEATDYPEDDEAHNAQLEFFSTMLGDSLGPVFYFYTIYAAPADSIHWMSNEELEHYGLDNL